MTKLTLEQSRKYLAEQCSYFKYGYCHTIRCVRNGVSGPTCEYRMVIEELERLRLERFRGDT